MKQLKVILPHKVSTNKFYGMYYHKRSDMVNDFHLAVRGAVLEQKAKPIDKEEYPVHFYYDFFFRKNLLDSINVSGMAKAMEDSLRSCKILENDSPQFVESITLSVKRSIEKYDYVIITR